MASVKAEKAVPSSVGQAKKEPAKAPPSKLAPRKVEQKPQDPKKKGTCGKCNGAAKKN